MNSKEQIKQRAEEILPWLIEVRRDFHQNPEFGFEEHRTSKQITRYLTEMGIPFETGIAQTGVVGLISGGKPGKTVALRADMDALPIFEQNEVPYKSQHEGKMHACGHDAHMTVLLGAAKLLQERKESLTGNVKLLFQPAEETDGGAKPMIEQGVLENPHVDAIFGLHVDPRLPVGQLSVKYGQMNASSDSFAITIQGENAHGASPHLGRDAIVIAAHVITALQTIVSRNVDPREAAVVTMGVIQGGTQNNIIADQVKLSGTIRTLDKTVRHLVKERVRELVPAVARSFGGNAVVKLTEDYTSLINDDAMVDLVKQNAEHLWGTENVQVAKLASLGVEDFAFFAEQVPAAFYRLGCRNEQLGCTYDLHHPRFNLDEKCLAIGAATQVQNVLSFLSSDG